MEKCVNKFAGATVLLEIYALCAGGKWRQTSTAYLHAKNTGPGSAWPIKGSIWGQTPFRVNNDPEISQLDAEYDPELGQSDPIIGQVCRKLTKFRVTFDTEQSITQMDPFPGHTEPGVIIECTKTRSSIKFYAQILMYREVHILSSLLGWCFGNGERVPNDNSHCYLVRRLFFPLIILMLMKLIYRPLTFFYIRILRDISGRLR